MRKGFDGLSGIVNNLMKRNPIDGNVYVFINRRRDKIKLLVWEEGGLVLYYKRLEKGIFELPDVDNSNKNVSITWEMLVMLVGGISIKKIIRKRRYKEKE